MNITEALDTFSDNLPDIIESMHFNLITDMQVEKEDAKQLGKGWIADEVRKLRIENKFSDRIRRLNRVQGYYNAKRNPTPGRITDEDIARARDYPVQDMYAGKLRKQGRNLWGTCAFHSEKTASMCIDTKKNVWYCHGACASGGDSIAFYMKQNNVDFIKAVKYLSNWG